MSWTITPQTKVPVDPYRSQVSLLLHGDGANGSTTITDSSPTPKTVTAVGNAQISTAQSKFGGSSIAFDGSGDYLTLSGASDDFLNPGDFTVEFWVRIANAASSYQRFLGSNTGTWNSSSLVVGYGFPSSQKLTLTAGGTGTTFGAQGSITLSSNVWYHIAVARSGSTVRLFVDGVLDITGNSPPNSERFNTGQLIIGGFNGSSEFFNGYIDELRITKGVARYTSNFTPPTAPFPDI